PMMQGVRGSIFMVTLTPRPETGRQRLGARSPLASLRLPDRLALLLERERSFLRVLGLEDRARDPALLLERRTHLLAQLREHLDARRDRTLRGSGVVGVDLLEGRLEGTRRFPHLRDRVLVDIEALERALLRRLHGQWCVRDHPRRVLACRVEQLVAGDD